jgi:maleamate amidohydrolase
MQSQTSEQTVAEEEAEDLRRHYERHGLAARVGGGARPALLVVDVQRGFTHPRSGVGPEADDAVAAIRELVDDARRGGVPVVYTTFVYAPEAETWARKLPANRDLLPGSEWAELDPRLDRRADEPLFEKPFASAFFRTEVDSWLRERDVDTVIVTGLTTSGCIRASVVDACSHGYRTLVPEEAVADRRRAPHLANLFDMDAKYADVLSCAEVRTYLASVAEGGR